MMETWAAVPILGDEPPGAVECANIAHVALLVCVDQSCCPSCASDGPHLLIRDKGGGGGGGQV